MNSSRQQTKQPDALVADVLPPLKLAHPFTYQLPGEQEVHEGAFVRVPLGPRQEIGVVWSVRKRRADDPARLKPIAEVFDFPPMPTWRRRFIEWVADYYVATPGLVLKLFLGSRDALRTPKTRTGWRAVMTPDEAAVAGHRMTEQRRRVLALALERPLPAAELAERAGVSRSVVQGLADAGLLTPEPLPAEEGWPAWPGDMAATRPALTPEQERAAAALARRVEEGGFSVSLLDGVTGSGKTEVYFEAMAAALARGNQVLLLLPEIALTGGFIRRVAARFGVTPAEWHSDVGPAQRARVFRGVAEGRVRVVVAARSGLFLPWRNLGLVVVDEEHESAYKQESGVPYQGRDTAVMLGRQANVPVILASATPSLESLVNAERGRYHHVRLTERFGPARLPDITLIDLKKERPEPRSWISPPLTQAATETLSRGEQVLFFLNRRGYAPLTICRACGHRLQCPHCATWMVQHRALAGAGEMLLCHHCGHAMPLPSICPECGAQERLAPVGPGVERLAEEAARRWPDARIIALSSDLLQGAALKKAMADIAEGACDIIVGTQLVAKGHHFPNLTLVGVIDADLALETADPRAGERTWQLLAQVSGRAGRGARPGRALIQTHLPEVPLMRALAACDREAFIVQEKAARRAAGMPPYGRLAAIIVSGRDEEAVRAFCMDMARARPASRLVLALGPAPAPIERLRGRWRWRFLLKGPRNADLQGYIRAWLRPLRPPASVTLEIDIDPYNFL